MINFKKVKAPSNTEPIDLEILREKAGNIYEAVTIISKRSNQINAELKTELKSKLAEFASYNDSMEEIIENREQAEISKFYEKVPKPQMIALQEFLDDKIYYRRGDGTEGSSEKNAKE